MRIIVLQGMPNTGKTSTIWLVRDLLSPPNNNGISTNFIIYGNQQRMYLDDFEDIIINYKSLKIGVYSAGDYSNNLASAVREFARLRCDVLVCALSTNNAKVRANNALSQFNVNRINKTIAPNATAQLTTNTADAQTIFNLI